MSGKLLRLFLFIAISFCTPFLSGGTYHRQSPVPPVPEWGRAVLDSVNRLRAQGCACGRGRRMPAVAPLRWSPVLAEVAQKHAADMQRYGYFDHRGRDGSDFSDRLQAGGHSWSAGAENIAWGYRDPESVVQGWLKSPEHCRNLMSGDFTDMGLGRSGTYWVQDLARPE